MITGDLPSSASPTASASGRSEGNEGGVILVTSRIFGVELHHMPSEQRLRAVCDRFLDGDRTIRIFTPNPEILLRAREDAGYAEVLNSADLALPDGTGVALVESLRARRRVRRWPGVEIGGLLLRMAAEREAVVVFLGGSDGIAERAAASWRRAVPGLRIHVVGAGVAFGVDGVARPTERDADATRAVASLGPTIVFVGLGAPKQERWIARNADAVPSARIMIGVGGAFDIWAERLRRAPGWLRRIGLEWAWRLALEPRRLPRMIRATIVFPVRALTDRAG
jgi:N-acetylglucosaminyldiphosphoundecaprenol N-acetyl-beta-D-mannosaminyltransferase